MSETAGEIFVTKKEFAERQGWSPSYVTKLRDQGRLVLNEKGRVDVAATLRLLADHADPSKQHVRDMHAKARVRQQIFGAQDAAAGQQKAPPADSANANYWDAKADREQTLAQLAKIELAEKLRELVMASEVQRALEEAFRMMRDMLMSVPARIAPRAAASSDVRVVQDMLRTEIRTVLDSASRMAADSLGRLGSISEHETVALRGKLLDTDIDTVGGEYQEVSDGSDR